jgi:thermitase
MILVSSLAFHNYSAQAAADTNQATSLGWDQNDLQNLTRSDGSLDLVVGVGTQPGSLREITDLIAQYGGAITDTLNMDTIKTVIVNVPASKATAAASQLKTSGYTRYVELNGEGQLDYVPNDANWTQQWGLQKIGVDYAWNTTKGDKSILVAVIDSGIDYNHPDLQANYVPLGYDWVNKDTDPLDDEGHGTACAGIIAATLNNEVGIAGVAQVKIMAEKIFDVKPVVISGKTYYTEIGGEYADMANSIIHATDAGADILSCSWYTLGDISIIRDAVNYATAHGVLIVTSAGNTGVNLIQYPAAYDDVISVTATDSNDTIASFSSYGSWVDVAAPGVNVYTTTPTYHVSMNDDYNWTMNYSYTNGTSFSCPMAAGVAALIWSCHPNITSTQVKYQLERTCDDIGTPGFDIYYGNGRINAQKAVETSLPPHDLVLKNWQGLQGTDRNETGIGLGESRILSATVTNFGSTTETGITVQFMVNGTVVYSEVIPQLAVVASAIVNYTWAPTKEGVYNITTYVQPVSGEISVVNNVQSFFTSATYKLALISDGGGSFTTVQNYRKVFDNIWVTYDLYSRNYLGDKYYTANLSLLQNYKAVIWDKYDRDLTLEEQTALNGYLASGGNLLVTTQGAVDARLADVIHSTVGDSFASLGGLIVVNSTNPIMDGHYGSFPVGYNYSTSDSAMEGGMYLANITADTARNATAIANTFDGAAKIIATSGLPGKVVFWNGGDYFTWSSQADCEAMVQNLLLWFMDDIAPTTTAEYDNAWHQSDFTVKLSATDFFGVNQTYYRINGGATKTVTANGQPQITTEGNNNTLEYWSVDFNGNQETHHTLTQIKLDKTAPTANAGEDKTVTLGESVTLNGAGSFDALGIVSYRWVLGDGTQANGASLTHTYAKAGTFTASLTVLDQAGNNGSASVSVVVNGKPAVTVTPTPTATPTATPTPTAVPTTNPTSTSVPETSSGALPDWMWIAVIVAALLGIAVGAVMVKRKMNS